MLVMGDVIENGQHVPLAERVWDELCGLGPFELVALEVDHYDESAKTTRVWGEKRKGPCNSQRSCDRVCGACLRAGRRWCASLRETCLTTALGIVIHFQRRLSYKDVACVLSIAGSGARCHPLVARSGRTSSSRTATGT